jgi:hypothetical protein
VVRFTPLPLYPGERALGTGEIGGWLNPHSRSGRCVEEKNFSLPGIELRQSSL